MCLGIPGQIVSFEGSPSTAGELRSSAVVDFGGVRRRVGLDLLDEPVAVGDHVLVHVGYAIRRIAPEDLAETLAFFDAMTRDEGEGAP